MHIISLIFLSVYSFAAGTPSISIYDSPSDKTKVVVEVCTSSCYTLVTEKKTLLADYGKILEWVNKIVDNYP